MICPISGCSASLTDDLDARTHALSVHSGRSEDGLPNGRFIHEAIPGAQRTICGLPMTAGKRDQWDNPRTDEGFAIAGHPICVACADCARIERYEGRLAL